MQGKLAVGELDKKNNKRDEKDIFMMSFFV